MHEELFGKESQGKQENERQHLWQDFYYGIARENPQDCGCDEQAAGLNRRRVEIPDGTVR